MFLIYTVSSVASSEYEDDCKTMSLNQELLEKIPVMNQGNDPICYAYTANQMWDYLRMTNMVFPNGVVAPDFELSSPVHTALGAFATQMERENNKIDPELYMEGNSIKAALQFIHKRTGSCSVMQDKDYHSYRGMINRIPHFQDLYNEFLEEVKIFRPEGTFDYRHLTFSYNVKELIKNSWVDKIQENLQAFEIPEEDYPNEDLIISALMDEGGFLFFFQKIFFPACEKQKSWTYARSPKLISYDWFDKEKGKNWTDYIDTALEIGQYLTGNRKVVQPVGISYCSNFLKNYTSQISKLDISNRSSCGNHASIIVERKKKNGVCQYKIKNSWGPCFYGSRNGVSCEDGNYWVPRDLLNKTIYSINYYDFL
ncbi:MAG: hypothetical protein HOE90_12475 [Bacteriovoracaceae bacterium]|nr:hypothetical protein [Bacteriovoracaceae bacterium]